jgi:hypothetical protein
MAAPSLEELEDVGRLIFDAPRAVDETTGLGSLEHISLARPDYDASASLGSSARTSLNGTSDALGTEIGQREQILTVDAQKQDELNQCVKDVMWDVGWDVDWDELNNENPDVTTELTQTRSRLISCIGDEFNLGPIGAENVGDYLFESIAHESTVAMGDDPTAAAFAEWATVTGHYSLNQPGGQ